MSDRPKGSVFSISVHPRVIHDFSLMESWFKKNFQQNYITLEHGNHWQCCCISVDEKLTSNVLKNIKIQYQKRCKYTFDDDENGKEKGDHGKAIVVKLHADPEYLIGYCRKDGDGEYEELLNTITVYDLTKCDARYASGEAKFDILQQVNSKFTLNQMAELFIESFLNLPDWKQRKISDVVPAMKIEVSSMISYQTFQKLKSEAFLEYLQDRIHAHRNKLLKAHSIFYSEDKVRSQILKINGISNNKYNEETKKEYEDEILEI